MRIPGFTAEAGIVSERAALRWRGRTRHGTRPTHTAGQLQNTGAVLLHVRHPQLQHAAVLTQEPT